MFSSFLEVIPGFKSDSGFGRFISSRKKNDLLRAKQFLFTLACQMRLSLEIGPDLSETL
jgi:hypothetical protein